MFELLTDGAQGLLAVIGICSWAAIRGCPEAVTWSLNVTAACAALCACVLSSVIAALNYKYWHYGAAQRLSDF
jgi:hypothetical protein